MEGRITAAYLEKMIHKGNRWAITALAMLYLKGQLPCEDGRNGRLLLLTAGRSQDRLATCRLALYYHFGRYSFEICPERAAFWRDKATRLLTSDAALIYDDPELARRALQRYLKWRALYTQVWGEPVPDAALDMDRRI